MQIVRKLYSMSRPTPRFVLVTMVLCCILLAASTPRTVSAGFTSCRSDPVITLSNGAQLDLQAGIADAPADVKYIGYTVRIPAGLRVLTVIHTGGLVGLVEHVTVYANNAANTYDSATIVSTGTAGVPVVATATAVSALDLVLASKTAPGTSGQNLAIHITPLL